MITNKLVKEFQHVGKYFIFPISYLLLCSFSRTEVEVNHGSNQLIKNDTVPAKEIKNLNWGIIDRLVPVNGVLKAKQQNDDSLIIRREDYESYARENNLGKVDDKTFTKVEIEPEYPGGTEAWEMYVKKNMRHPEEPTKNTGTVIVMFVVESDGTVHDVEAVAGPTEGSLRDEAIRLVKMSEKWNSAIQNFRLVRAYKKQPVSFTPEKNQ